jgi:Mce-associated membrane protein
VTVVVEDTPTTAAVSEPAQDALAPWHFRAGALAVDVFPAVAALITLALTSFTVPARGAWWWSCMSAIGAVILVMLVNRLLLPTITGWSLGRALFGIAVVGRDGAVVGPWTLLLRDLAHLLDTASVVGWLWPLWDSRRRTFADMLLRTEVRRAQSDEPQRDEALPNIRRWTAVALLTAAAVCLAGAAVSYAVVYSRERATDESVAEITAQGPKMVAQMLTYDPKSLHDDFAHAQSLATDKYRGQLKAQQDIVQKGTPVINEYWPMDWSVQSASPDRATMLLFLQGRRGVGPDQRYISASLRVNFAKGGDDRWRVDDLTVLTKPKPAGNGK